GAGREIGAATRPPPRRSHCRAEDRSPRPRGGHARRHSSRGICASRCRVRAVSPSERYIFSRICRTFREERMAKKSDLQFCRKCVHQGPGLLHSSPQSPTRIRSAELVLKNKEG